MIIRQFKVYKFRKSIKKGLKLIKAFKKNVPVLDDIIHNS